MKTGKIILCLFIIGLFYGCSGGGVQQAANQEQTKKRLLKVLTDDQLVSHAAGQPSTPLADDQTQPAVAFDTSDPLHTRYLVVWTDYSKLNANCGGSACGTDIRGAICTGSGTGSSPGTTMACGDSFDIATSVGNQAEPKVAFYKDTATPTNSKYLVVWTDSKSGSYSQIFGQFVRVDTTLLNHNGVAALPPHTFDNFAISFHNDGIDINQFSPDIIYDAVINKFVVAWVDVSIDDTAANIATQIFTPPGIGGKWLVGDTISINHTSNIRNVIVSFSDNDSDVTGVTDFTPDGLGTPNVTITIPAFSNAVGDSSPIKVSYGNIEKLKGFTCNNYRLVPYFPLPANADQYVVRTIEVSPSGILSNKKEASGLGVTNALSEDQSQNFSENWVVQFNESKPKLAYSSTTGDYFIGWSGMNHTEALFEHYTASPLQSSFSVFNGTGSVLNPSPPPATFPTWQALDSVSLTAPARIATASVTIGGNVVTGIGNPFPSGRDGNKFAFNIGALSNAVNSQNPIIITFTYFSPNSCSYQTPVFTDVDKDAGISKIKIRKDTGLGLFQDFSFGAAPSVSPSLAVDPNTDRLLVAWEQNTGGETGKDIIGQLVDLSTFLNYGSGINISAGIGDQSSPATAFDNVNQRFLVVWEDARNQSANISNVDIYGQFVDPQGNLSGANAPVTVSAGNQLAPAVSFGDVDFRKFFVVWTDGRDPSNADIFGQLMEFSTAPQLLITDAQNNPILNGAIDFGNVNVNVGSFKEIPFKLCNNGNTQLTINNMSSPDAPYSFTTPSPVTISPGTCYDMTAHFEPTAAGSFAGNPTNNFKTTIDSNGGKVILYFSGSGVGIQPLSITTTSLPDGSVGSPYAAPKPLSAFGGVYPYKWSVVGQNINTHGCDINSYPLDLTHGLCLNTDTGVISGTPSAGVISFTAQVTDNNNPKSSATRALSINVSLISVTTTSLKSWTQNTQGYNDTLLTNGTGALTWSIIAGSGAGTLIPVPGLTISPSSGAISGQPTTAGSYTFTVKVIDGSSRTAIKDLSITINPAPVIITSSLSDGIIGTAYSQSIVMTGGTSPPTWTLDINSSDPQKGPLPPGLILGSGTGVLSGTPTSPGIYPFTVKVTDNTGTSAAKAYSVTINSLLNIINPTSGLGTPPGPPSPPVATLGTQYPYTFVASGGTAPYSWSVPAGSLPTGLSINPFTGGVTGSASVPGTFTFTVQVQDVNGTTVVKTFSIIVSDLLITTNSLKSWTKDSAYKDAVTISGGVAPFTFTTSGSFPPGLSINAFTDPTTKIITGKITGTPSAIGNYNFTVTVTDHIGVVVNKALSILINPPMAITTDSLPSGSLGILYSQPNSLFGGTAPFTWTISSGSLPAGLLLDPISGIITGVPITDGLAQFTVLVTDASGATAIKAMSLTIESHLGIDPAPLPDTTALNGFFSYNQSLKGVGGIAPYTWALSQGILPVGLNLDAQTGSISGNATAAGTYIFVVKLTDAVGTIATSSKSIKVYDPIVITTVGLKSWTKDSANYKETLVSTGGKPPLKWSVNSFNNLPDGLSIDPDTGVIHGQPSSAGTFSFILDVTDANGAKGSNTFTILINPVLSISSTTFPGGTSGLLYSQQVVNSGGTAPYVWTKTGGSLPPGLLLDPATGAISGIPTQTLPGVSAFTVTVTDAAGANVSKDLSISIFNAINISTLKLDDTFVNKAGYNQTLAAGGGRVPYAWSIIAGVLPTGLTLDGVTGIITGTPTVIGKYNFIVQVTDIDGRVTSNPFSIDVTAPSSLTIVISTLSLPNTFVNKTGYSQTLGATGGTIPYKWSVQAGTLPAGLTLDGVTGIISGTPTTNGKYDFIIQVTDVNQSAATQTFSIIVGDSGSVIVQSDNGTVPQNQVVLIPTNQLPSPLPPDFNPTKALSFEVDGVTASSVDITFTFSSLTSDPVFFKVKANNQYQQLQNCASGATNCIVSLDQVNKKLVVRIEDNGIFDSDLTTGIIKDPIVAGFLSAGTGTGGGTIGTVSGGGGGGCSVGGRQNTATAFADTGMMLTPLFVIMVLRGLRRRRK